MRKHGMNMKNQIMNVIAARGFVFSIFASPDMFGM